MYSKEFKLLLCILCLFYVLFLIISPTTNFGYDQYCWIEWVKFIHNNGLGNAYNSFVNYSPAFLYALKFFGWMAGSDSAINDNIHYLRNIVIVFDIAGVILAARIFQKFNINPLYSLFILFNIGYLYNTAVWGQVDCVYSFFAIAAIYFAMNKRIVLACIFAVISYNLKLQSIIFMPIIALLMAPHIIHSGKKIMAALFTIALTEFIILLPFILHGHFNDAFFVSRRQVDLYPVLSMNAYNIWYILFPKGNPHEIQDVGKFIGMSYKLLGVLMFMIASFFALLPLVLNIIIRGKHFLLKTNYELVLRTSLMVAIIFFFFNTQMHERYSHPIMLLAGILCLLERKYMVCILLSIAYVLNMEAILRALHLSNYGTLIFSPIFVGCLYALALLLLFIQQYRKYPLMEELKLAYEKLFRLRTIA